jgi:endonuclease/exonuclease/phosphatase family metal-dependent hydrolase
MRTLIWMRTLLLGALLLTLPAVLGAQSPLRILSWNVDGERVTSGSPGSAAPGWDERLPRIVATLRSERPHLTGLQEIHHAQLSQLRAAFPELGVVGVGAADGAEGGAFTPFLFDPVRLELTGSGTSWLSQTPDTPGSRHFGNTLPRAVTWARFLDREDGREFLAANVQLDDRVEGSRELSLEVLQDRIQALAGARGAVILTADLGEGEGSRVWRILLAATVPGLGDPFRRLHPEPHPAGTRHGYGEERPPVRSSAILASRDFAPHSASVVDAPGGGGAVPAGAVEGPFPSDHNPVRVEVYWESHARDPALR